MGVLDPSLHYYSPYLARNQYLAHETYMQVRKQQLELHMEQ